MSAKFFSRLTPWVVLLLLAALVTGTDLAAQEAETQVSVSVSNNLAFIGDIINLKILVKTTHNNVQEIKIQTEKRDFDIIRQQTTERMSG